MTRPPGPRLPALVQTARWLTNPYPFLLECHNRFGDVFAIRVLGWGTVVVVADPASIKQIFTAAPLEVRAGEANELMRPLLGDDSLMLLDGERHLHRRRLMMPPFHGKAVGGYGEMLRDSTRRVMQRWPVGRAFALQPHLQEITLDVMLLTTLGATSRRQLERYRTLLASVLGRASAVVAFVKAFQRDLGPWSPGGWFRRRVDELDRLIADEIRAFRAAPDPGRNDVLALLAAASDPDGTPIRDGEIRDQIVSLLVAGHDTPATALAWAVHWLVRHPEVERRVVEEIQALGPDPAPEALWRLPYLGAVCEESLRITPPVELVSRVADALTLGGYGLAPGDFISPCGYLVHRRPDLYPDPEAFRPERFIGRTYGPHEYMPFGGGVHRCLGATLALHEMKVVLGTILAHQRLERPDLRPVRPVRRNVMVAPGDGARVVARPRAGAGRVA